MKHIPSVYNTIDYLLLYNGSGLRRCFYRLPMELISRELFKKSCTRQNSLLRPIDLRVLCLRYIIGHKNVFKIL